MEYKRYYPVTIILKSLILKPYLNEPSSIPQTQPAIQDKPAPLPPTRQQQPPPTVIGSRKLISKDVKMFLDSDDEDSEEEDYLKKMDGFEPVKGEVGLFYKVRLLLTTIWTLHLQLL